jgi:hypothetical protein
MMERFLNFIQAYRSGILFLLLIVAIIAFLIQWIAWIFGLGRFRRFGTGTGTGTGSGTSRAELRYIFSEATVKIINDFRHLLALVIVLIFAFALGYSLIKASLLPGGTPSVIDNMKEALQAVVATLGGLVGSIIGYYFGESSVVKAAEPRPPDTGATNAPEVQKPPPPSGSEASVKAPPPPVGPASGDNV